MNEETLTGRLGYRFADPVLLERALTHRSCGADNNERLEFLGDGVLNLVTAATLYDRFPTLSEGELSRVRASLVRQDTLAQLARAIELGQFLKLGSGELKSGGFDRDSILADGLEAVIGAVFKDGGFGAAQRLVLSLFAEPLAQIDPHAILKDPKTQLQEYLQKRGLGTPVYRVLEVLGEPHKQRFRVECLLPGCPDVAQGEGSSRRGAEQAAAARALERLESGPAT